MLSKRKSKSAVSLIVSYVLLILIAFSVSGLVYAWLKGYASPQEEITCDDNLAATIKSYNCTLSDHKLNLTLKNTGLFKIDGFILRVDNRSEENVEGGVDFGRFSLTWDTPMVGALGAGEEIQLVADLNNPHGLTNVTFLEVQPFINGKTGSVYCKSISTRDVFCV